MDESQSGGRTARNAARESPVRRGARRPRALRGTREWAGWLLVAAGAVLCVLGWYGVSGERFAEQQIPYLASSTIPGAALIVAGAVLVALRQPPPSGRGDPTDLRVERLYALLIEPDGPNDPDEPDEPGEPDEPDEPGAAGEPSFSPESESCGWLAVPGGTHYHRPDCPLVAGKDTAVRVGPEAVRTRGLTACPVCEPPTTPDGDPGAPDGPAATTRPGESAPPAG
ncbi:hypothetical protein ACFVSN_09650 [Kitasatospora sp. NPDC057904]|uniref:hypothetical protein n=1 Tax=Kitasatospora sp. NPDC057904 TaxID=3346275 RepID=UPI0036DB589D